MFLAKSNKKISQKEYLKKYLSGDTKKRKHKSHKPKNAIKVKIIDDDANLIPDLDIDEELLLTGEDAPQIVGTYIEEKTNDEGKKWRSIVIKDEVEDEEEVKTEIKVEEDLWGPKSIDRRYKDEFSPERAANGNRSIPSDVKTEDSRSNERKKKHRKDSPKKRKTKSHRNAENFKSNDSSRLQNNYSAKTRDSSSDQSPPLCRTRKSSEGLEISNSKDQSPPRRRRRDSSEDQSPPRRKVRDRERSPSRYNKGKSSRDQSPPRRRSRDKSNDHRRRQRRSRSRSNDHTSHGHRKDRKSDSDQSPPRARGSRSAFKSSLKIKQERASPDLSPKRYYNGRYEEGIHRKFKQEPLSPKATTSKYRASRWEERKTSQSVSPPPSHKPKVTTEGKRAGLQDAKSLQQECEEFRLREDEMFKKMTSEASGRDAEVQVRDYARRGRRAREVLELDPAEELRKEAHEKKKKDLYDRWGKGLKQIEAHRARIDEDVYEGSKPLARYSNDADLEKHLRDQERADDPMLEYMRKRRKDPEKQTNAPIKPTYKGSYPENRFDLRPGYRWDGVDRSNGYEKKWFDKQNEKRAAQDEAYMYSVEDM